MSISIVGLAPLLKVWADYLPPPKNQFIIKINGEDYYTLVKEEIDFDPSKIEAFNCGYLKLNEVEVQTGSIPWILDEFEEKITKMCQG